MMGLAAWLAWRAGGFRAARVPLTAALNYSVWQLDPQAL
jgi:hypothetical protein